MATTLRLAMELETRAKGYASALGVPLSALIAIALKDYLDARESRQVEPADMHGSSDGDVLREALQTPFALAVRGKGRGDRGRKRRK